MLRLAKPLIGYTLAARDGEIGRVDDLLFDDEAWVVRYLVANTRKWLPGRKVIIPPNALDAPDWAERTFPVALTKKEIEQSPPLAEEQPVSRQHEIELYRQFEWPGYWMGTEIVGAWPEFFRRRQEGDEAPEIRRQEGDSHLRSLDEVSGYRIGASDGEIGHLEDLILEDQEWWAVYLVVDTRNWLPGRKVIVSPQWVERFDWAAHEVTLAMDRDNIARSPEFDPATPVNRDYEEMLYDYYGRPKYWD